MREDVFSSFQILWENNFFHCLFLSSRRSGGSILGFRASSLKARSTQKQINIKALAHKRQSITIKILDDDTFAGYWCHGYAFL